MSFEPLRATPSFASRGTRRSRARERGATLVESIGALFVASIMLIGLSMLVDTSMKNIRDQQAAQFQSQVAGAATQLVQANYATLASSATATTPAVVPLSASSGLQLSSYLPPGLNAQNVYGQTPCLLVFAPSTGGLDARLVTEGGQTIPDVELGYIAANSGAGGGSIPAAKPGTSNTPNSAAYGAYGSWVANTPNPSGASCTGKATGPGHLVSEIYSSGPNNTNSDFLYRVGVPGYADANTMHVPIYLADQTHVAGQSDSACGTGIANSAGKITTDASGQVLSCSSAGYWQSAGSLYWRDPVASQADLPTGASAVQGDVALALDTGIPYEYTGSTWHSLVVDNNGNLNIGTGTVAAAQMAMTASNTIGSPCDNGASLGGVGQLSVDATGHMLSCIGGTWQDATRIDNGAGSSGCLVIIGPIPSPDFGYCQQYTGAYPDGVNVTMNGSWYVYNQSWTLTLTRPGVITASVWGHMSEQYCQMTGLSGHLEQAVVILDNDNNNVVGSNWAQTPGITDTSAGISENLVKALSPNKNGYRVEILTSWATYSGQTMPYQASTCAADGSAVPITPLVIGWNINSYY